MDILKHKIVVLAGEYDTTPVFYNTLKNEFNVVKVVIERPLPRSVMLRNRAKKLGALTVLGQILFLLLAVPFLKKEGRERIENIKAENGLDDSPIDEKLVVRVDSVNSPACIAILRDLRPDLVLVHGTRIISQDVLDAAGVPFMNIHAGITPAFRGSHGGYWALAEGKAELCGVTVHLIDKGIDTGGILGQKIVRPGEADNFLTYPYLQLAAGLRILKEKIKKHFEGGLRQIPAMRVESGLFSHPTLWKYLLVRIKKGVK